MAMSGSNSWSAPTIGARVVTADGDELGKVKEIVGSVFKIDASMQPDYWLPRDCVSSTSTSEVRLSITKDRLGDAKVEAPARVLSGSAGVFRRIPQRTHYS